MIKMIVKWISVSLVAIIVMVSINLGVWWFDEQVVKVIVKIGLTVLLAVVFERFYTLWWNDRQR